MNIFGNSNSKNINPRNILGGILGSYEDDGFERETALASTISNVTHMAGSTVSQAVTGVFEATIGIGQNLNMAESKTESKGNGKFPTKGSIEFNKTKTEQLQKQKTETDRKKAFFQALKEDQDRAQRAKEKLLFEEEINDIVTNLPTEQKNELLHYQASYRDRNIYQRAELRKKLIEQRQKAEKQEKAAAIPSPAKQPSAIEGAFEGRSGTQGSGSANLSAQAVG